MSERAAGAVSLRTIALQWTRIGVTGFGGPPTHIALLRRLVVEERQWLDHREFEDGLAACNLLPGPASTQLAIFLRLLAIQGSWNYEILLGNGIGFCLEPALRLLPEGVHSDHFKSALARESKYFNAHPYLASVAVGALARAELDGIAKRLAEQDPAENAGFGVNVFPVAVETLGQDLRRNLLVMLGAVGFVLLIAMVNIANLLLARATAREREIGVRLALGASRARLVRQLLTESILLSLMGGIAGIVLAFWLGDILLSLLPATPFPIVLNPEPDGRVLLVALSLAVFSGALFGIAPALHTGRTDLTQTLRERTSAAGGGAGSRWSLRNLLVIAQIGISLFLLIGSALFGWIINGFAVPPRHATDLGTAIEAIPGTLIGLAVIWFEGVRRERAADPGEPELA